MFFQVVVIVMYGARQGLLQFKVSWQSRAYDGAGAHPREYSFHWIYISRSAYLLRITSNLVLPIHFISSNNPLLLTQYILPRSYLHL